MKSKTSKRKYPLYIGIIVIVILIIVAVFAISAKQFIASKKIKTTATKQLSGCQPEGLSNSETLTYYDQQTNKEKPFLAGPPVSQINDAKKWEQDAYLVAMIHGKNLTTGNQPVAFLYASSCTSHYLLLTDEQGNNTFTSHIITTQDPVLFVSPALFADLAQVSYDAPLDIAKVNTTIPDFIQLPQQGIPFTLQGQSINADSYSIQLNLSKRYGIIYQVMFMNNNHLSAVVTYKQSGDILTLTTY